jgi:polysaccharide export outer membrane protein/exopolysaccharide production protein ExoF
MADSYQLGPQDKVRIKVFEWRATRDQVFEWTALNDQFTVAPDGMLSLPFAGQVKATGRTPAELASLIAQQFQAVMRLGRAPDVSLEVSQFRPFYIVGRVERPGEFPYRPGLTVLQAVSIAGGMQRTMDPSLMRLGREAISSRGELRVLSAQANSLMVRKARLQAELAQSETISFPDDSMLRPNVPLNDQIRQQEKAIFDTRLEAFRTETHTLNQLKTFLQNEVVSLEGQLKIEDEQIRLVQTELQSVNVLVEKGLTSTPRKLSLERTKAQIEGDRLRVGTLLLKAKQEISRNDIAILELQNKRAKESTLELRDVQSKLDETHEKLRANQNLLYETEVLTPGVMAQRTRAGGPQVNYKIVRQMADKVEELEATEDSILRPGDTIKVEIPMSADFDGSLNSSSSGPSADQRSQMQTTGSWAR